VLGFDPHKELARFETFFQRIHPDDQARTMEQLERASREKTEVEFDYRIVHPGGEIRDIHTVGHPVFSPSGDLVEFVGTVMDVTDRRRADEERERLRQYLISPVPGAPAQLPVWLSLCASAKYALLSRSVSSACLAASECRYPPSRSSE